ncbi:hypothetical protein B0A50_04476 [Salinomyces thailandicus]|uniref:Uncharacterized protein n=1 Tax=Salinomyces thailandicus TaxID=706561 RepID=A0A4V5N4B9_9PEZI|nr:hypothetical protein B0A50_04476 [Salinomyces thailandica]
MCVVYTDTARTRYYNTGEGKTYARYRYDSEPCSLAAGTAAATPKKGRRTMANADSKITALKAELAAAR